MQTFVTGLLGIIVLTAAGLALFTVYIDRRIARKFQPSGHFLELNGRRLHYVDVGKGPAVVMVHGLGGQLRHFSYALVDCLKNDFRMILIDRPGSGHSPAANGACGIRAQGDLVAHVITALRLERPVVVGHSLGGAVALSAALDHPDLIGALALIAPVTHVPQTVPEPFRAMAIRSPLLRWLISRTVLVPLAMRNAAATLRIVFGPDIVPADFPTAGGGMLGLRPSSYLAACMDMQGLEQDLPGMAARYPALKLPVGILFGTQDRILDWQAHGAALRAQVGHLHLETIPGGHMLPLTNAPASAAFIRLIAAQAEAAGRRGTAPVPAWGPVSTGSQ